ncbi:hypothetical protein MANES_01G185800v8 [Manihot esculenta]|uniref:Uncharacterized protein n=1 Tax=Manihot esculenta TaxID=3983 RepID=A0ACB7IGL8_MANES|nr:hypothetical protein MANES_01G185800v8 [Manihot esculenta]
MGSRFFYTIKTQFHFLHSVGFINDFVYDSMYRILSFICSYTLSLFGSLFRHIFRFQEGKSQDKFESNSNEVFHQQEDDQFGSCCAQLSEIKKSYGEGENSVVMESVFLASTNKYEFLSGKGICGFVEEPVTLSFTVHELFPDSNNDAIINTPIADTGEFTDEDFQDVEMDAEPEDKAEKAGPFFKSFVIDEASEEKHEQETLMGNKNLEEEELISDDRVTVDRGFGEHEWDAEKKENSVKSLAIEEASEKPEPETSTEANSSDEPEVDALDTNSELLVNGNDGEVFESEVAVSVGVRPESSVLVDEEKTEHNREIEAVSMRDQFTDSDDEYIEIKLQLDKEMLSKEDLSNAVDKEEEQKLVHDTAELEFDSSFHEQKSSDSHVQNDTDYMYEDQDIIEQLKMGLKLARTGGLPTILEESESEELEIPKPVHELRPMKVEDQKFEHKDLLEEIRKIYKSYLDKMRKLDVLNFQTMHSLSLLQMKDTVQFQTARKSSTISLLSQNLLSCRGTAVIDPMEKVIADMQSDLETIYVGQLCLSWEILLWQYRKAQELQKYDSQGSHQYNQVADEFQLFQVLVQRFLENEQFQGPRVLNYVKSRCILRSLLQVPLVKEDSFKDKCKGGDENEDAITSQMLIETIEQSMRDFWEFLRADKEESSLILRGHQKTNVNLQDHVDSELLTDIRTDFQKDKKLKDILRSGSCIMKRFKRQKEEVVHHIQTLFIAQVELKLISRVLNMSKLTTDQLIWCHEKLDKINLCNRKVFVESSFLLFPC